MEKKMNKKWLPHIIAVGAFVAFIVLGLASATTDTASNKTAITAETLKEYLDSQPANSPDTPINITLKVSNRNFKDVVDIIKSTDKYVNLVLDSSDVEDIGNITFLDCKNLISIKMPLFIYQIRDNVFRGCTNLTSITLGSFLSDFNRSAFLDCPSLTEINVAYNNKTFSSYQGVLYDISKSRLLLFPQGKTGTFTVPNSVTSIAGYAFYQSSLSSVTIPQGGLDLRTGNMFQIGQKAFNNCTKLTSISIGGIIYFEGDAFDGNLVQVFKGGGTYTRELGSNTWRKQ